MTLSVVNCRMGSRTEVTEVTEVTEGTEDTEGFFGCSLVSSEEALVGL